MERPPLLLTGTAHPQLTDDVAKLLKVPFYAAVTGKYADSEALVNIPESVRRRDVFIVQPTCPPDVNRAYIEAMFMVSAAKRSSAGHITLVMPYAGYARADRQNDKRTSIGIADLLKSMEVVGTDEFMFVDLHAEQSIGAVTHATDHLNASSMMVPEIKALIERERLSDVVIAAPDQGGTARLEAYAKRLRRDGVHIRGTAYLAKERDRHIPNQSRITGMTGNVRDANVIIIDDIYDTGGSLRQAAIYFKTEGARRNMAAVTHGLFSDTVKPGLEAIPALDLLRESPIDRIITTNSVKLRADILQATDLVSVVNIAPLLAAAIYCVHGGHSLTDNLEKYLQVNAYSCVS